MTIYTSTFPDVEIPSCNVWDFVRSNPQNSARNKVIFEDAQDPSKIVTVDSWQRDTRRWATGLSSIGFKRGDVLAIFSFNQYDYSIVMYGSILMGGITTTANAAYNVSELVHQLSDSAASVVVAHPEMATTAIEAAKQVGIPLSKVFVFGDVVVNGLQPYKSIMPPHTTPEHKLVQPIELKGNQASTTTAVICYSSGTTGKSKGVELSHLNLVANCLQISPFEAEIGLHNKIFLAVLPFYHIYAIQLFMVSGIYNTSKMVVLQKFTPVDFLKTIQDHKCQYLNLVPPQILLLVKAPITADYDLSSMQYVMSGAAPCPEELTRAFKIRYPTASIKQGYGMSEMSPVSHVAPWEKETVHGSIGLVVPNLQVRLVDPDTGLDAIQGERGEIWCRGKNIMMGYRNNIKATKDTIDEQGWLHTGDIAYVDKRGFFFIVDRLKELIKYKGFQVAPAELEALLISHPEIADAAVIGVENKEQATEVPLAFVVRAAGSKLSEKEIIDFVASKVAKHKKLRGGVRLVQVIPKSAAGKILRKDLRALIAQEKTVKAKL